jgi:RNA polymerase sigma-B factor
VRRREERALFERLARDYDPAARDALVERFWPLARQLARRYHRAEDLDDLEQVAAIGLMKAIDRFDLQELAVRVERLSREMVGELGRAPTVSELAERAEATSEQVLEALLAATARHAVSLDQPRRDGEDPDAVAREVAVEESGFAAVEDTVVLDELMRVLSERDRLILTLRFREDRLQSQIAEIVGVSQMQVSRLTRHAIAQLQQAANG